jgi:hypothetical protein
MAKILKGKNKYELVRDVILREYEEGNIVVFGIETQVYNLKEFIKQPVDGILYDLNRSEETVLTWIEDKRWINDFAVAKVIRELKQQLEARQKLFRGRK